MNLRPKLPIQHPIVNRLAEMLRRNRLAPVEIGDRPGNAENLVVCPGGKAQLGHRGLEQIVAFAGESTELAGLAVGHVGVVTGRRLDEAGRLPLPGGDHLLPHLVARRARRAAGKLAKRDRRDLDMNVDPVQQRAAYLAHVTFNLRRRAMAIPPRVAPIATRARVQRRDQHEVGRERGAR